MKSPAILVAEFVFILVLLAAAGVHRLALSDASRSDRPVLALTGAGFWGGLRIGTDFVLYADGVALYRDEGTEPMSWRQVQLNPAARDELLSTAQNALLPVRNCFSRLPAVDGPAINIFLWHHGRVLIGGFRGVTRYPSSPKDCGGVTALYQRLKGFDVEGSTPATRLDADGRPSGERKWIRAIQAVWPGTR